MLRADNVKAFHSIVQAHTGYCASTQPPRDVNIGLNYGNDRGTTDVRAPV